MNIRNLETEVIDESQLITTEPLPPEEPSKIMGGPDPVQGELEEIKITIVKPSFWDSVTSFFSQPVNLSLLIAFLIVIVLIIVLLAIRSKKNVKEPAPLSEITGPISVITEDPDEVEDEYKEEDYDETEIVYDDDSFDARLEENIDKKI